jgi:DNA-binding MarR family transcriptional regulator
MTLTFENREISASVLNSLTMDLVRRDEPDLSLRQLTVLSQLVTSEAPLTVRGLAAEMSVSKPAITRAMDRLAELGFAKRDVDRKDRRSVLLTPTQLGREFIANVRQSIGTTLHAAGIA